MTDDKPKTALIYYRVSTEEQASFGLSLEQQEKACRQYAEHNGIEIIDVFHDDGRSAKTTNREGLQEMLSFCTKRAKDIDCVIVYKIDRLTRNVNDYSNVLVLLSKLNIKLVSTSEAVDETPIGQFIGNFMAANAQLDNQVKGERTRDCMKTKFEKGYWIWRAPLGYKNIQTETNDKIVVPDPERAPLITWMFKEYATGIHTLEDIRVELNAKGLKTRAGKKISSQAISKMIRNSFYWGEMHAYGIIQMGFYDPLIDQSTFLRCQELISGSKREDNIAKKRTNEAFPLRHFITCGYCGRPMTGGFSTGKGGGKFPYYRCYYKDCPTKVRSIPKKKLENEFHKYLKQITRKKKFLKAFKAVILDVWDEQYSMINQDRQRINTVIDKLEEEKKSLIRMKKKELIPDEDFRNEFDEVKIQLTSKRHELEKTKFETFDIDEAVNYVFGVIADLPEIWNEAKTKQKQQLQGLIFPEKPVYLDGKFETPELSPVLVTKKTSRNEKPLLVTPGGIEPPLPG